MKHVRHSKQFQDNLIVQREFGDICIAYQIHIRNESQAEMQRERERFEQEKEQYEQRVKEALRDGEKREAELRSEVEEGRRKAETEIDSLKANFDTEREELKERIRTAEQCECTNFNALLSMGLLLFSFFAMLLTSDGGN